MSRSIYRTGSAGGKTGPTCFIPTGKKRHLAYTDDYLKRYVSADGYMVDMTDNGYMEFKAWEELTPNMAKGIINLPII